MIWIKNSLKKGIELTQFPPQAVYEINELSQTYRVDGTKLVPINGVAKRKVTRYLLQFLCLFWINVIIPLLLWYMAFQDPLYRFYEREVNLGCKILKRVRSDLRDIIAICRGEKKQTNDHRSIIDDLNRGMIPGSWVLYKIPSNSCTVIQWINDFVQRVKQLEAISSKVWWTLFLLTSKSRWKWIKLEGVKFLIALRSTLTPSR